MTDTKIRTAIAKTCGWKFHIWEYEGDYAHCCLCHLDTLTRPLPQACNKGWSEVPPDYPNDLNAMHEAEKVLDDVGQRKFAMTLHEMVRADLTFGKGLNYWTVIHTTARQRAEAFLRTIGKWK